MLSSRLLARVTHLAQVVEAMAAQGLECQDVESLRSHHAKTLWHGPLATGALGLPAKRDDIHAR